MTEKSGKSEAKRRRPDWSEIKREYQAGVHSTRALAKLYGVSEAAIRKKQRRFGWTCNLSAQVKKQTQQKLLQQLATKGTQSTKGTHSKSTHSTRRSRKSAPDPDADKTPEQIEIERAETVKAASDHKVSVVTYHQRCLRASLDAVDVIEGRCKQYLEDPAKFNEKKYPFRGGKESPSDVVQKCANVKAKIVPLERQAYGLDEISEDEVAASLLEQYMRFCQERDGKGGE